MTAGRGCFFAPPRLRRSGQGRSPTVNLLRFPRPPSGGLGDGRGQRGTAPGQRANGRRARRGGALIRRALVARHEPRRAGAAAALSAAGGARQGQPARADKREPSAPPGRRQGRPACRAVYLDPCRRPGGVLKAGGLPRNRRCGRAANRSRPGTRGAAGPRKGRAPQTPPKGPDCTAGGREGAICDKNLGRGPAQMRAYR